LRGFEKGELEHYLCNNTNEIEAKTVASFDSDGYPIAIDSCWLHSIEKKKPIHWQTNTMQF